MKACVISLGSESSEWTCEEMRKYFEEVDHLNLKLIEVNLGAGDLELTYEGKPMKHYDCAYIKGSFRYAPLLRSIASVLEKRGTFLPLKPSTYTIAHDKLLTHLKLKQKNVPMPMTYVSSTAEAAKNLLERIHYPIVLKLPKGTQGKGVMIADTFASASSMLDALSALKQPFIIQEFIDANGEDLRLIVVGDKVVASMKRKASSGEQRANIHAGGTGEAFIPDQYTQKLAVEAAKAVGAKICGVDVLEGIKGPVCLEVNSSPGLQGITGATKVNVAERIAKFLYDETKFIVEGKRKKATEEIMTDLNQNQHEIITSLDFRSNRILLPPLFTQITKFNEKSNVVIKAKQGELIIKKFN